MQKQQVSYSHWSSVHYWLKKRFGKATKCENPNCTKLKPKIYHWALRAGETY